MKKGWMCRVVTPDNGQETQKFATLAEAKLAMRQKITDSIDVNKYLSCLEPEVAAVLGKYLSDPHFPQKEADLPEDYDDPDCSQLILDSTFIRWDYMYGAAPRMNTNLVLDDNDDEEYTFDFWYARPEKAPEPGVKSLSISIVSYIEYGTSAYPLMVWKVLQEKPQTQKQLAKAILHKWGVPIERKAVGRHLQLLETLGYPVEVCETGYYCGEKSHPPKTDIRYTPSAYPLLILKVLSHTPQTKAAIIRAVQERFGAKIDRKAVGRHLELLDAFGYHIHACDEGYSLEK